jgi:hypothetical protein
MILVKRLLIVVILFSGAAQAAILDITFSPLTKTVSPGDTFTMDIWGSLAPASGITNVDAGGLLMTFDAGVVNLASPVVYGAPFVDLLTTIDNTAGTVAMAFGNFSSVSDPGLFLIATLSMTAGDPPSSPSTLLDLSVDPLNPFVWDFVNVIDASDIAVTDGAVNVVPVPAAAWLMLSGLVMLGFNIRRFELSR